jgi:hypothetical protein
MDQKSLKKLLNNIRLGNIKVDEAIEALKYLLMKILPLPI